jgi:hypothetical protein
MGWQGYSVMQHRFIYISLREVLEVLIVFERPFICHQWFKYVIIFCETFALREYEKTSFVSCKASSVLLLMKKVYC